MPETFWKGGLAMMFRPIMTFFQEISRTVWFQLPLFVMLIVFSCVPACFGGDFFIRILVTQALLGALLLSLLASLKRWVWWLIFAIANLIFFVELSCYFSQHTRLNSVVSVLILQTNVDESKEFIGLFCLPILKALVLSVGISLFFAGWDYLWKKGWAEKTYNVARLGNMYFGGVIGLVLCCSLYYSPISMAKPVEIYSQYYMRMGSMSSASTYVAYYYDIKDSFLNPEIQDLEVLEKTITDLSVTESPDRKELTIVYVIGESFGRGRCSLFGYPLETNPRMNKELNDSALFVFDNVITHSAHTIDVYRCMLSTYDILSGRRFAEYPILPAILKKGGFKIAYYDNQSVLSATGFDFSCAYFLSNPVIAKESIDMSNSAKYEYDGTLVDKCPPLTDMPRSLTIYHLMGQHQDFKCRYPEGFSFFTASDYPPALGYTAEQAELAAEYDNATRYNDMVLADIIDRIRDKNAIMIYAPDHGEEIYDYDEGHGRPLVMRTESVRPLCEIPVMIWVSEKYRSAYPEDVEMLRNNTHKPIYNADLSHTILQAAGIRTETFIPDLSLLGNGKGRADRVILESNFRYDANREKLRSIKMRYEK